MVECARVAVVHDARLCEFYERVKRRRGEQKALVAVACKMLKIVWFMLTWREPYQSMNARLYGEELATKNFWLLAASSEARSDKDRLLARLIGTKIRTHQTLGKPHHKLS